MRTIYTISFISLLLISACSGGYNPDYKDIEVAGTYTIQVPESMKKSNELHDFAGLQYVDEEQGFFLIGIIEASHRISGF